MLEAITQSSLVFPFLSLLLHLHKLYWYDAKQLQVSCVHMEKVSMRDNDKNILNSAEPTESLRSKFSRSHQFYQHRQFNEKSIRFLIVI
jgi:hypothetical protein